MKTTIALFLCLTALTTMATTTDIKLVKKELIQAGAVEFTTHNGWWFDDYENIYLGYDKQHQLKGGIIVQVLKESYKKITAYVLITKSDKTFTIDKVIIPDLKKITKKGQRENITKLIEKFNHFKCATPKQKHLKLDAVSKATFCHKNSYKYINEMAEELIEYMEKDKGKNKQSLK